MDGRELCPHVCLDTGLFLSSLFLVILQDTAEALWSQKGTKLSDFPLPKLKCFPVSFM